MYILKRVFRVKPKQKRQNVTPSIKTTQYDFQPVLDMLAGGKKQGDMHGTCPLIAHHLQCAGKTAGDLTQTSSDSRFPPNELLNWSLSPPAR